uniref:Uncharacterized protein n=1 Tax=Acrobeloides nanus TaxID=290746 RepID=A0A914DB44_9BILA
MKTQLNTREEMDSEVKILQAHFEELQKVVKEKDEIISKAELKEREISILAAERTRKELEAEFDLQIQRIEKELRIQNAAQIQANHQVVVFDSPQQAKFDR